jgi:hypothetical protein
MDPMHHVLEGPHPECQPVEKLKVAFWEPQSGELIKIFFLRSRGLKLSVGRRNLFLSRAREPLRPVVTHITIRSSTHCSLFCWTK